ncbi:MAG: radical SAM protein [Clostridiales Family XIII bacterium]|jgi:radical SAM superfamily enzyme YgiQ (UPF0313 family)|nr:radical SAM protein [Clostridiales Family XIII bacterium]
MKIALLSPSGAMHRYNGMFHKNLHYAPITLPLLAALVPEELNAEIRIYDESAEAIPLDLDADIIAMTCITGTAPRVYKYADYFRSRGITVLLGGVHPTLMPEEAALHADSVLTGLGEETFPAALRDFVKGTLRPRYEQECRTNIEGRPLPRKDLLKKSRYITLNTVEAIRGCCHDCTFCAYPAAFGQALYKRTIDDIVNEIKTMKGKFIIFPDVNLIADRTFAIELFTALIPLKKWWLGLTTTVIYQDEMLMKLMRKSGCKGLLIGFESVNQATQDGVNKGMNQVNQYHSLMSTLHKNGIMVMGCFALGGDEDERDVFTRTAEMCVQAKIDLPRFAIITPFPKTAYYAELEAQGRIVERDFSLYDVEHVVYTPKHMSKSELEQGMDEVWRKTYTWKNILRRFDWKNIRHLFVMFIPYFLLNVGYRQYAKRFAEYGDEVMTDNSDIPEPMDTMPIDTVRSESSEVGA